MPVFNPGQLAAWTGGRWTAAPAAAVTGFSHDTRELRPGQIFVALRSEKRDGHDYLPVAAAAGASGALVGRADPALALPQLVVADPLAALQAIARAHRRAFPGPVVAVTGSVGKTSTKDLIALLLGGAPSVLATEGNLNNHIGVPLTLARLDPSVHRHAVVEAGVSAAGEMEPLAAMIEPDLVVVTLVAPAHLQELGDLAGVAREKAVLAAARRPGALAVFPRSCLEHEAFRSLRGPLRTVAPAEEGSEPPGEGAAAFTLRDGKDFTLLTLLAGGLEPRVFTLRRVSVGMGQNAALALCAALHLGVPPGAIPERLAAWRPARWRGELRRDGDRWLYLDCYNASPVAMADALDHFGRIAPAGLARVYVLGCMEELGPEAPEYHRRLGRSLRLRPVDRAYVVGGQAGELRAGLLEAGNAPDQVAVAADSAAVAGALRDFRGAVFLKGSRRHHLEKALDLPETLSC